MTTKFDTRAYSFADSVEITGTVMGAYDHNRDGYRRVFRKDFAEGKVMKGKIIGIGKIMVGKRETESYDYEEYYCSRSGTYGVFVPEAVVLAWKVVVAMTNKPILCLPEQIRPIDEEVEIPVALNRPWTEEEKNEMRDIMKDAPRDDKGRWIKSKQPVNV